MNITKITKFFRRSVSDNNYGNVSSGVEITVEEVIDSPEKLKEINDKLAKNCKLLVNKDIKSYFEMLEEKKVI
jgi:hypothetical protein